MENDSQTTWCSDEEKDRSMNMNTVRRSQRLLKKHPVVVGSLKQIHGKLTQYNSIDILGELEETQMSLDHLPLNQQGLQECCLLKADADAKSSPLDLRKNLKTANSISEIVVLNNAQNQTALGSEFRRIETNIRSRALNKNTQLFEKPSCINNDKIDNAKSAMTVRKTKKLEKSVRKEPKNGISKPNRKRGKMNAKNKRYVPAKYVEEISTIPFEQRSSCLHNSLIPPSSRTVKMNSVSESLLPTRYPVHFTQQLPLNNDAIFYQQCLEHIPPPSAHINSYLTPEISQSYDLEMNSTSSTPSLPESLRGVFETDDIRDILNVEKIVYRLTARHVQALAIALNVQLDFLTDVIEKILALNPVLLEKIDMAMKQLPPGTQSIAARTRPYKCQQFVRESSESSVVAGSQSPTEQRIFASQRLTQEHKCHKSIV